MEVSRSSKNTPEVLADPPFSAFETQFLDGCHTRGGLRAARESQRRQLPRFPSGVVWQRESSRQININQLFGIVVNWLFKALPPIQRILQAFEPYTSKIIQNYSDLQQSLSKFRTVGESEKLLTLYCGFLRPDAMNEL